MVLSKKELGEKIKSARNMKAKEKGGKYTQEMMAADLGISRSYLGDIEAGRKYPNFVLLGEIAELLEINDILPTKVAYEADVSQQDVIADTPELYSVTETKHCLSDEDLTDDECAAIKAFLEVYRKQKQG